MDWPVEDTGWSSHDLNNYDYDERPTWIIKKIERGGETSPRLLRTEKDWEDWFEKAPSISAALGAPQNRLFIMLCSRAPPVFEGQQSLVSYLPFKRDVWYKLTREFHVHRSITRTISRRAACFSSTQIQNQTTGEWKMSFTARMSASLPNDLAMSVTHFPKSHETFAVVYGCDEAHIEDIEKRIKSAGTKTEHPLLLMAIFVELERKRLVDLADELIDKYTLRSKQVEQGTWDPSVEMGTSKAQENLMHWLQSRELLNNIRAVKRHLAKFLTEIDPLSNFLISADPDNLDPVDPLMRDHLMKFGSQMKQRVQDIIVEYEEKVDECNMLIENASLGMQTAWNHLNTDIAAEAKREGTQMKFIALLTMIYLPLSSVASIFSMTMFNWEAREGEAVVSQYIWVFIALAVSLTGFTFFTWRLGTNRIGRRGKKRILTGFGCDLV